jgi:hypothetical protein
VNDYYGSGCYNCGGWNNGAAAAAGMMAGAALTEAANNNAYTNGYVQGEAASSTAYVPPPAPPPAPSSAPAYATNDVVSKLPKDCAYKPFPGQAYYQCGTTWFEPAYGANGVYYRIVPTPY